jgi:hypothetical protein
MLLNGSVKAKSEGKPHVVAVFDAKGHATTWINLVGRWRWHLNSYLRSEDPGWRSVWNTTRLFSWAWLLENTLLHKEQERPPALLPVAFDLEPWWETVKVGWRGETCGCRCHGCGDAPSLQVYDREWNHVLIDQQVFGVHPWELYNVESGMWLPPFAFDRAGLPLMLVTLGGDAYPVNGWAGPAELLELAVTQHPDLGVASELELLLGDDGTTVHSLGATGGMRSRNAGRERLLCGGGPLEAMLLWRDPDDDNVTATKLCAADEALPQLALPWYPEPSRCNTRTAPLPTASWSPTSSGVCSRSTGGIACSSTVPGLKSRG